MQNDDVNILLQDTTLVDTGPQSTWKNLGAGDCRTDSMVYADVNPRTVIAMTTNLEDCQRECFQLGPAKCQAVAFVTGRFCLIYGNGKPITKIAASLAQQCSVAPWVRSCPVAVLAPAVSCVLLAVVREEK